MFSRLINKIYWHFWGKKKHIEYLKSLPRRKPIKGKILGMTKKNCHEILTRKGFKKHAEPYSYSKWRNSKERIHIKLTPIGFCWHIDNH